MAERPAGRCRRRFRGPRPRRRAAAQQPSSSSSPAGPPTTRTCRRGSGRGRTARRKFAASTACLSRSRIARRSAGPWWRSKGSEPPGPSTASIPAAEAGAGRPGSRGCRPRPRTAGRRPPGRTGPRLTQSADARGMPSISATAAVSSSPAPAATTLLPGPITSIVPAPRSTTTASSRPPGVVRAPSRAAAGSLTGPGPAPGAGRPGRTRRPRHPRGSARRPAPPGRCCPAGRWPPRPRPPGPPRTGRRARWPGTGAERRTCPPARRPSRGHAARSGRRPSPRSAPTVRPGSRTRRGARAAGPTTALAWSASARLSGGRVTRLGISRGSEAERAERNRIGQDPQGVAGRAHLDRQQRAGRRRGRVTWSITGRPPGSRLATSTPSSPATSTAPILIPAASKARSRAAASS